MKIVYVHEPTDLQCGQAVLSMLTGIPVQNVCDMLCNRRETNFREMKEFLEENNISLSAERKAALSKSDLPDYALLSLETPRCWHWSLFADGIFYDPEHGVSDDFPAAARKYYWEILL